MKDRLLIAPAGALFFVVFTFAMLFSIAAFFFMICAAIAWKPYAARGGSLPGGLTEAATKFGVITVERR